MSNVINIPQNRFFKKELFIKNGEENYQLQDGEKIIFGVKVSTLNSDYVLKKELTAEDFDSESEAYILILSTSETNIEIGQYCYDVALQRENGELEPIIKCTEFNVSGSAVRSG